MDERQFFQESEARKSANLNCSFCKSVDSYELRWLVRKKRERLPANADDRDRAKFAKSQSYMLLLDDKVTCKNQRCRRPFEISGVKTIAYI